MWIKDVDGNLVNLSIMSAVICSYATVEAMNDYGRSILYNGENPKEYMTELEKELAAFGKLVKVEIE